MNKTSENASPPQSLFDETLRRMLARPHDPHKPPKAKKKPKASKKKPA